MKIRWPYTIALCLLLCVSFATSATGEIRSENKQRSSVGYLDGSGRIEDASRSTIGFFSGGRVEDGGRSTIGFINEDGRIEDAGRVTIGYVTSNGRVQNASRSTIGYVNPTADREQQPVYDRLRQRLRPFAGRGGCLLLVLFFAP